MPNSERHLRDDDIQVDDRALVKQRNVLAPCRAPSSGRDTEASLASPAGVGAARGRRSRWRPQTGRHPPSLETAP